MSKRLSILFLFLTLSLSLQAQRVSYPELFYRSQAPTIFIDDVILPGESNQTTTLAFIFRFNNDFLPYKKIPLNNNLNAPDDAQFYTIARLNSEIFEGSVKRDRSSMQSVNRDFWTDTLFTSNYEDTQSDNIFASGSLVNQLKPGMYNFILQLNLMQEKNERNTQRRNIRIPDFSTKKTGEVYLIRNSDRTDNQVLELMNLGDNVPFGENFQALIRIPDYDSSSSYQIEIYKATLSRRDTTAGEQIFEKALNVDEVFEHSTISLKKGEHPALILSEKTDAFTYAIVEIPNETFENSPYLLHLTKTGEDKPVAKTFFQSYWPDMPASLYNLNISIDMLKFIVNDKELNRLRDGNAKEKERKFREFWESKDPTPNTVYNELMAEYYRRIDYAFEEFGSQENPMGHESDQGEIYIKFGPPNSTERVFPTDDKTREIWKYPNRTFVFETTSGFGDFKLVGTR